MLGRCEDASRTAGWCWYKCENPPLKALRNAGNNHFILSHLQSPAFPFPGPSNGSWPNSTASKSHLLRENYTFLAYYQHSSPVAAVFIVAYTFIFLMCMIGNFLVCFIVVKNRQMRTVTNMFILNLAISDLLVGIFCMPTTLVDNLITGEWGSRGARRETGGRKRWGTSPTFSSPPTRAPCGWCLCRG